MRSPHLDSASDLEEDAIKPAQLEASDPAAPAPAEELHPSQSLLDRLRLALSDEFGSWIKWKLFDVLTALLLLLLVNAARKFNTPRLLNLARCLKWLNEV